MSIFPLKKIEIPNPVQKDKMKKKVWPRAEHIEYGHQDIPLHCIAIDTGSPRKKIMKVKEQK